MNYYKVSFTCESPVCFDVINDHVIDEIFDFIEEKISGEVGIASWNQIDEHGDLLKSDYDVYSPKDVFQTIKKAEETEAIPIEWIWKYWDDGDQPKNYAYHIRRMINEWKEEQAEKGVILHPSDL